MEDSDSLGKRHIRKKVCSIRESQDRSEIQRKSTVICNRIVSMEQFSAEKVEGRKIALYFTHKGEVDLTPLKEYFIRNGAACYFPVTYPDKIRMEKYDPALTEEAQCRPGAMGILEPGRVRCEDEIRRDTGAPDAAEWMDWIFLPGIAFDMEGNRIGYGKGYYDRYLAAYPEGFLPLLAAPAFEFQLYRHFPHEPHDIPVAYIITEERIISTKSVSVS